jgi:hypothetical protein
VSETVPIGKIDDDCEREMKHDDDEDDDDNEETAHEDIMVANNAA